MDKKLLKEIVFEQRNKGFPFDLGIERDKLNFISKHFSLPHSLVISGIRRVGKSTLLGQIINNFYKDKAYYFSFEDERLLNFKLEDFNVLYEIFIEAFGDKKVFFLDEIQNIPKWEIFVRRMQDSGNKFFITGSNASLLSKELGTKLTGRVIVTELYPFSFKEFLLFKKYEFRSKALLLTKERAFLKKYFNQYLKQGGMPEFLKYNDQIVLKRVYEDILYRDVVVRHDIKEVKALRELSLYLLSNIGSPFSYNNLKKVLSLGSVNTVKSYIGYLEDSFLIFSINKFSYSLKKQFVAPKKVYCVDNGLMEAISFKFSKNRRKFYENVVFIELKRRNKEIYYYKTEKNLEIDFLIREGSKDFYLIQVTESMDNDKVRKREINALISAMNELKIKTGLILTADNEENIKFKNKNIIVKPIYKWLLEEKT